jgi:osmotically-inducible protein OsmY
MLALAASGMAAVTALSGCVPLVVGGAAVGGTVVATDRRSSATVLNDEGIELRAGRQIYDAVGGSSHISVTSWNGRLLLTGEVPTEQDRQRAEQVARGVENVREVINDLAVMPSSGLGTRTNDSFITSKVKSALAGAANVSARNVKVITERGSTYLMGSVTREEAEAATEAARLRLRGCEPGRRQRGARAGVVPTHHAHAAGQRGQRLPGARQQPGLAAATGRAQEPAHRQPARDERPGAEPGASACGRLTGAAAAAAGAGAILAGDELALALIRRPPRPPAARARPRLPGACNGGAWPADNRRQSRRQACLPCATLRSPL